MKCVFCCQPQTALYKSYGEGSISLLRCTHCKRTADPYVEYDWVLVFLDVALLKAPVFRHVLCNEGFPLLRVLRFASVLLLVETFIRGGSAALSPADLLAVGVSVAARLVLELVFVVVLLRNRLALPALLVGRALPSVWNMLALVWDYTHLSFAASHFFATLSVASVAVALHAATEHNLWFMFALSTLVRYGQQMLF